MDGVSNIRIISKVEDGLYHIYIYIYSDMTFVQGGRRVWHWEKKGSRENELYDGGGVAVGCFYFSFIF